MRTHLAAQLEFSRMPPQQQEQVRALAAQMPEGSGEVSAPLLSLLASGRLTARGRDGHTTLDALQQMSQQRTQPGLYSFLALPQLVAELADPGIIHQGDGVGSCTATTLQFLHCSRYPADYARVVAGLFREGSGRVALAPRADGSAPRVLQRNPTGIALDNSGRNDVDRIYQSSVMALERGAQGYDNRDPNIAYNGAESRQVHQAWQAISGTTQEFHDYRGESAIDRWADRRDLEYRISHGGTAIVALDWGVTDRGPAGHELLLNRIDERYVSLRNPWGGVDHGDTDHGQPRRDPVNREGEIRMTRQEFEARLSAYTIDPDSRSFGTRVLDRLGP